jgi:hypothetical protein
VILYGQKGTVPAACWMPLPVMNCSGEAKPDFKTAGLLQRNMGKPSEKYTASLAVKRCTLSAAELSAT